MIIKLESEEKSTCIMIYLLFTVLLNGEYVTLNYLLFDAEYDHKIFFDPLVKIIVIVKVALAWIQRKYAVLFCLFFKCFTVTRTDAVVSYFRFYYLL